MTNSHKTPPADVLVIFGITGDLAKVMTFHSLYRLEARGLLELPDRRRRRRRLDASSTCASTHASASKGRGETVDPAVFARFAARLSYVSGDFTDAGTYERLRGGARRGARARSSTWRSRRSCSGR